MEDLQQSPELVNDDPRIPVIREFIASGKSVCPYGQDAELAGKIQYAVAPTDMNPAAFDAIVERFYEKYSSGLIVLAPEGFNIQPGEIDRATAMAEVMNEQLWMAFAKRTSKQLVDPDASNRYHKDLEISLRVSKKFRTAQQPVDEKTMYNIQAMGPFYKNQKHYRYAPGDLFLLLVRMSEIHKLQRAKSQQARIEKIRYDAFKSTTGVIDFMALVVPEDMGDLAPIQEFINQIARKFQK